MIPRKQESKKLQGIFVLKFRENRSHFRRTFLEYDQMDATNSTLFMNTQFIDDRMLQSRNSDLIRNSRKDASGESRVECEVYSWGNILHYQYKMIIPRIVWVDEGYKNYSYLTHCCRAVSIHENQTETILRKRL